MEITTQAATSAKAMRTTASGARGAAVFTTRSATPSSDAAMIHCVRRRRSARNRSSRGLPRTARTRSFERRLQPFAGKDRNEETDQDDDELDEDPRLEDSVRERRRAHVRRHRASGELVAEYLIQSWLLRVQPQRNGRVPSAGTLPYIERGRCRQESQPQTAQKTPSATKTPPSPVKPRITE